jgi:hypothetical protein
MKGKPSPHKRENSHRHDHVNLSHFCVNHTIANSSVNIEEPIIDQIEKDVEVLEAPCGNGVWHIESCPLHHMFNVPFCKNPPSIHVL